MANNWRELFDDSDSEGEFLGFESDDNLVQSRSSVSLDLEVSDVSDVRMLVVAKVKTKMTMFSMTILYLHLQRQLLMHSTMHTKMRGFENLILLLDRFYILSSLRNLMERMNFRIITSLICYIKCHYYIVKHSFQVFLLLKSTNYSSLFWSLILNFVFKNKCNWTSILGQQPPPRPKKSEMTGPPPPPPECGRLKWMTPNVGYISHVHWAYDYSVTFGVLWVPMAWHKKCATKNKKKNNNPSWPS